MRKVLGVLIVFLMLSAATAWAGQYDWVIAGSEGYMSSYSYPVLIFNGSAGENVALIAMPLDYYSTSGYCGLAPISDPYDIVVSGYTGPWMTVILPISDLYVFTCLQTGGLADTVLLAAGYNNILNIRSQQRKARASNSALDAQIKAVIQKLLNR